MTVKRKWPRLVSYDRTQQLTPHSSKVVDSMEKLFRLWLVDNLYSEELDRVAPIVENDEFMITENQLKEAIDLTIKEGDNVPPSILKSILWYVLKNKVVKNDNKI